MIVAKGLGWPYLDADEIVLVMVCAAAIAGLIWGAGYIIWQQVQLELYRSRRRRAKQEQAEKDERDAIRADRERMLQMRAEGWPVDGEDLPVEQIDQIVRQATAVHRKLAAAITRRQVESD
ncbi:hypothetical protein [Mycobacteroides abscessus]|uniref:hypothetical protein n=1 Tax=Mycobacteroides abscessus TaxID=36809 RepID=UPI0021028E6E|nr:hypothetical protein [Mycobacteroides abscessus]